MGDESGQRHPNLVSHLAFLISSKLSPNDIALEHHLPVHDALRAAGNSAMALPDFGNEDVKSHAGRHLLPELAVLESAEADETLPADELLDVNAGELRRRFDHQHARQQWSAGDVAGHPEFVVANVFEAQNPVRDGIRPDHAVELLHVAAVRVNGADGVLIQQDLIEIDFRDVENQLGRHL